MDDVWMAMADHFLDTETRHDIPLTALRCVEAGLSVEEARDIWCYEVSPAVAFNVWSVAGEWAGWDAAWLRERIEAAKASPWNQVEPLRSLLYRLRVHGMHSVWRSIERCMWLLLDAPPSERRQLAQDLAQLARVAFDFCPEDPAKIEPQRRERLLALGPRFRHALAPVH